MSEIDVIRDSNMDAMIEDIISIFKLEGVELVRLSGLTLRARRISGHNDMPVQVVDSIVRKLKQAGILHFHYITKCPHCGEVSYQVVYDGKSPIKPKLCDSCNTIYQPLLGSTLER